MPQGDEDASVVEEALKESEYAVVADLDSARHRGHRGFGVTAWLQHPTRAAI